MYHKINSGIYSLMDDLGSHINNKNINMLGGGNPAILNETVDFFAPVFDKLQNDKNYAKDMFLKYTHPMGDENFRDILANFLNKELNWTISKNNICITNGSQQAFYMLFNYLVGSFSGNKINKNNESNENKKICILKEPDYIGYFDLLSRDLFTSIKAKEVILDSQTFEYSLDFDAINATKNDKNIKAYIVSSPNNPSSHTLNQKEYNKLASFGQKAKKFVIFDHAYGCPFPSIVYGNKPKLSMNKHTVYSFSLSKLGFPSPRCGILVGNKKLIKQISIINGILNLAPSNVLGASMGEFFKDYSILKYCNNTLKPFYEKRKNFCVDVLQKELKGYPVMLHKPGGGFFVWLKAVGLNKNSHELYELLKKQNTIVVSGDYFFLDPSKVAHIRISYAGCEKTLHKGLLVIAKTIKELYDKQKD